MKHFLLELIAEIQKHIDTRYPKRVDRSVIGQIYFNDLFFEHGNVITIEAALERVPDTVFALPGSDGLQRLHFSELSERAQEAVERENEAQAARQLNAGPQPKPQQSVTAAVLSLPELEGSNVSNQAVITTLRTPPLWPVIALVTLPLLPTRPPPVDRLLPVNRIARTQVTPPNTTGNLLASAVGSIAAPEFRTPSAMGRKRKSDERETDARAVRVRRETSPEEKLMLKYMDKEVLNDFMREEHEQYIHKQGFTEFATLP